MIINIILFVTMYPILIVMYFGMKSTAKLQNGITFGATMKKEWLADSEIEKITTDFYKEMKKDLWILAIAPLSSFVIPYVSIQLTIWMFWLLIAIVVFNIPLARANKKIKNLKLERGWCDGIKMEEYTEIKAAGQIRRVKFTQFAAPVALSILSTLLVYVMPAIWDYRFSNMERNASLRFMILIFAVITLLLYGVAVWMDRQKTEVISSDSDVNVNYSRAKKNIWKNYWLAAAWLNTFFTMVIAVTLIIGRDIGSVTLWGTVIYTVVVCVLFFPLVKKMNHVERTYRNKMNTEYKAEDDRYWIWGSFYYNPWDKHTMVNKRAGIGTTVNMATTAGKVCMIITVLTLAIIPITSIWIMMEEFTPISLTVSENCLQAEHLKVNYEIPVEKIDSVELVYEKPEWSKMHGTAMDNLDKGTFYEFNVGECEAFMNPQNAVFLRIKAEDITYYMSGVDDEQTMEVYEIIK